jgi:hypothetical protein
MFYGIIITMRWSDHQPAHFHARFGEHKAVFDFEGNIIHGSLPKNKMKLVEAWVTLHKEELEADWVLSQDNEPIVPIDPLR